MRGYEDALGYNCNTRATAAIQHNWDKYAHELQKRTPGHPKQNLNYKGVSADYVSTGMLNWNATRLQRIRAQVNHAQHDQEEYWMQEPS